MNATQKSRRASLGMFPVLFSLWVAAMLSVGHTSLQAQSCSGGTPSVLAEWNMTERLADQRECNGETGGFAGKALTLAQGKKWYCPNINNGCGQTLLGSRGFKNTQYFDNAICLVGFFTTDGAGGWSSSDPSFNPNSPNNLIIDYTAPIGKTFSLTSFSLKLVSKQGLRLTPNIKQGVAVFRNEVLIYETTVPITSVTTLSFPFPNEEGFRSDGSTSVRFEVVFGLVHTVGVKDGDEGSPLGYDDLRLRGICVEGSVPSATISPSTCSSGGAANNGSITVENFAATDRYHYVQGSTYTGGQTYATATPIPAGGVIVSNLPNPGSDQPYTVRIFGASGGCYDDMTLTLPTTWCTVACDQPTGASLTAVLATCTGATANNNAQIQVAGVVGGDRVGFSAGTRYTGVSYSAAQPLIGGAYTFTGVNNPTGSQVYTVRVYNGGNDCYIDRTVELKEADCGPCRTAVVQILKAGGSVIELDNSNNSVAYESCKNNDYIDLALSIGVVPNTGTTCPTNTDFVWTITLTNEGTMTATDIQVADVLPESLILVASNPSVGYYTESSGWLVPSLAAGASVTLGLTTKALTSGSFQACAYVNGAFPDNDIDSSPHNDYTANEDDDACTSITVTGPNVPTMTKEFSPQESKTNVPISLTIKISNNSTSPVTLTQPLVDNLPSIPGQMTVATVPNLISDVSGVIANAGSTSITIPSGAVLQPGLNQIKVDVVGSVEGVYCNEIASGALVTSTCTTVTGAKACVLLDDDFVVPPIIGKTMEPSVVQINQNSTLTITIENRNATNFTVVGEFADGLPDGLVLAGAPSGTCPGITTFGGNTHVGLSPGSIIPPGTCTIIVPVTSASQGTYCNRITQNALIVSLNPGSGTVEVANGDLADACLTVTSNPCTTVSSATLTPATTNVAAGGTVLLEANATGTNVSTIYKWDIQAGTVGSFTNSGKGVSIVAPTAPGTYNVSVKVDNKHTGHGTCEAVATAQFNVMAACVIPTGITFAQTAATCNGIVSNNNGMIRLAGHTNGLYYGVSTLNATAYNGPDFASATAIPAALPAVIQSGIPNTGGTYIVRIFNVDNACYTDEIVTVAAVCCSENLYICEATSETYTLTAQAGLNDYQWYLNGNPIAGANSATYIASQAGTYTVTAEDGSGCSMAACCPTVLTALCGCTNPSGIMFSQSAPTCTGTTANNNGSFSLTAHTGGTHYGVSTFNAGSYDGPTTIAAATIIPGALPALIRSSIPNTGGSYIVRVFNGLDGCYVDQTVVINPVSCVADCVTPTQPVFAQIAPGCVAGVAQNNGTIRLESVFDATHYGVSTINAGSYNGPATVAAATAIPGVLPATIISNIPNTGGTYRIRIFNTTDDCYIDRIVVVDPAICVLGCTTPTNVMLASTPPTCSGLVANNDGTITLSAATNGSHYGISSLNAVTYNGPAFESATAIPAALPAVIKFNVPNASGTYMVRVYNGSDDCYTTTTIKVSSIRCGIRLPLGNMTFSVSPATCTAGVGQDNGIIRLESVTNGTHYGISTRNAAVYNGSAFAGATVLPAASPAVIFSSVPNTGGTYIVRVYNGDDDTYRDQSVTVEANNCRVGCTSPSAVAFTQVAATCTGATANNNGTLSLSAQTGGTHYGISTLNAATYNGAAYGAATPIPALPAVIQSGIPNTGGTYIVRVYSADGCFIDESVTIAPVNCVCTPPSAIMTDVDAPTCVAGAVQDNGAIYLQSVTNGTHVGISTAPYTGPTFAAATPISGFLPMALLTNVPNTGGSYVVRVYNGSQTCFTEVTVNVPAVACPLACTTPTGATFTQTAATCNVAINNNDGTLSLSAASNATHYGISALNAGVYNGPNYAGATQITVLPQLISITLPNVGGTYIVRLFNGSNDCFDDETITVTPVVCGLMPASLGDVTWIDLDRNGVQNGGEPRLQNVTVRLFNANGTPVTTDYLGMPYTNTTTTNATGYYEFLNLAPGDYYVVFDLSTVSGGAFYTFTTNTGSDSATNSDADPATGRSRNTGSIAAGAHYPDLDAGVVCAVTAQAGTGQTICSTALVDLTAIGASITPTGIVGFGATWTTSGTGQFLDAANAVVSPARLGTAVSYRPSAADVAAGQVILTLTTDNPAGFGSTCTPASDDVMIIILKVNCGTFPWGGN